ncbi:MAG TPA: hypothetical protein VNJ11_08370 [Bryobacteraceae bacterium]|nr:hypothetical protein [Bryobacteraceae bacterium]
MSPQSARRKSGRLRRCAALLCLLAAPARPEVIDRIAVIIGRYVITESALLRAIRVTAFLNGEEPDFSPASRRLAAERLVDQTLIRREMETARYALPDASEVAALAAEIRKERFKTPEDFRRALERYRITEDDLHDALARQLATLRFIELRFRPAVVVPEAELRRYYETRMLPEWQNKSGTKPPPFEEVQAEIEQLLAGEQADRLLEEWLKQARSQTRIEFKAKAFE